MPTMMIPAIHELIGVKRSGLSSCYCNEMLFRVDFKNWFSLATGSESES